MDSSMQAVIEHYLRLAQPDKPRRAVRWPPITIARGAKTPRPTMLGVQNRSNHLLGALSSRSRTPSEPKETSQ